MDRVVTKLTELGWKRIDEQDADSKPRFVKGKWKCMVGTNWTTFYEMVNRNKIGDMRSMPTINDGEIMKLAKRLL